MPPLATLTVAGPTATLTLDREDARNALSIDLLADLHARIDEAAANPSISILTLTGRGRAFCAGMDLKAVASDDGLAAGLPLKLLSSLADFTRKLRALQAITIASVNGAAIGGGCGLACVTDFTVTHADSKMGFPEVDLGVCPAVVAPWLVRRIGPGPARRVLLMGGLMTGAQAHACGIATHLANTREALDAAVADLVAKLASGGPGALRATKNLLNELDDSLDPSVLKRGAELSASVLATPEAQAMLRSKLK